MIKLGGKTKSGRKFVVLGLSEANITKLREGKPIVVHGVELGVPELEVLYLHWGQTEDDLAAEFKQFIDKTTQIHDQRGEKKN